MSKFWGALCAAAIVVGCGGGDNMSSKGLFDGSSDIGQVGAPGAAAYDAGAGEYALTGSGENVWGREDAFHFAWTRAEGDIFIATNLALGAEEGHPHRKAGVMIRSSLEPDSPYVDVVVHADGQTSMQYRTEKGGETREIVARARAPKRIALQKEDDLFFMSMGGEDGELAPTGGSLRVDLGESFYAGLMVTAHDNATSETARFSNVAFEKLTLAPITNTGYGAAVDSTLEILNIESGNRRIVRHFDDKMEAPNWSRDGLSLIYNRNGLLYRIPVEGGEPEQIDTGPLVRNNNDHGLSPDGSLLAVSDQSEPDNLSRIYVLPADGASSPRLVIGPDDGPSYWHAWSPDGETLVYTASRAATGGDFDIYAIPVEGGPERRVTTTAGLDDGADYTPDGAWIYFNSSRSGNMKIWRIRPDGTGVEQVTFDENYRDWFPHPSPDGKWLIFVSFGLDIDVDDHPPNRKVVLRLAPLDGSAPPRVVASLFGGQGTINVPSWSPDSREVAFVSYRLDRE